MNIRKFAGRDMSLGFITLVSIFVCGNFFLFEPVKCYMANHEEYWFTLRSAFPYYLVCFALFAMLLEGVLIAFSFINRKIANIVSALLLVFSIGTYIQSNFLPNTIGTLNGHPVDWSEINIDMVSSIFLWIAVLAICGIILVQLRDKEVIITLRIVCICFILLEITVIAYLFVIIPEYDYKYDYAITNKDECNLSNTENFIIVIADAFDASYLYDQVEDDRASILFEDFTYYDNVTSMYGHTDLSIPQMISGKQYKNDSSYKEYLIEAYSESPLLNRLFEDAWNVGLYFEGHIPKGVFLSNIVNLVDADCTFTSRKHFLKSTYRLVAYSISPYPLKRLFWFEPDFSDLKDSPSDDYDLYSYQNGEFYEDEELITFAYDTPVFRLYHTRGMHLPMHTTSEVEEQYDAVSMEECREANYKIFERIINALKKEGVYDNSVVIVMADHGESSDETGEWKQNPVMLIKGKNESHSFCESSIPFTYADLQKLYINLLDGKRESDVFDEIDISENRERIFYRYMYGHETLGSETFPNIIKYVTNGNANNIEGFVETGEVYYSN